MINFLMPFVKDMNAQALVPYQTFLKDQEQFIRYKKNQFDISAGHESYGIRLMRYIFSQVDWTYMKNQVSNLDRYMYHIRFIKRNLYNTFDRAARGRGYYNIFFCKTPAGVTEEFIMPVEDTNSITNLPLTSDKWIDWQDVRPLRIWAHNSNEFTVNILKDQVQFRSLPPTYAVVLIDVVALTIKYYTWYQKQRMKEDALELAYYTPEAFFLHKYVMTSTVWDLADIWLINQLRNLLDIENYDDLKKFDNYSLQTETQYGRVALTSRRGFEYLYNRIKETSGNLRPEALMSSPVTYSGSIFDRIRFVDSQLNLPLGKQYEYLHWLRDKDLLFLFLKIWQNRTNIPTYGNIYKHLRHEFRYVLNHRPWNSCNNILLKNAVQNEIESFADLL